MSQDPGQSRWRPSLGAVVGGDRTTFTVWAPGVRQLELVIDPQSSADRSFTNPITLERDEDGVFSACVNGLGAGRRYRYRLDSSRLLPDPASRYQPEGVHGPSQVVDPAAFEWTDEAWGGVDDRELVIYELHVGTFSPEGTFAGVEARLDRLASLGVTALELMPVVEFAGRWNWGYDGVDLFAPSHRYGTPDDLRRLVDGAHARGLGVILDVVYNHLGPDGAYVSSFSPYYFNGRHKSPWGDAVNLDGPHSERVRAFFVENALHWIHEYHLDGLRLDATHALQDDSEVHFLAELALRVDERAGDRCIVLVAEDERNLDRLVRPPAHGGFGLDAVWSDDFHHHLRRHLAGDAHGYFRCFSGQTGDIATTIRRGWFFVGRGGGECESRGTDPSGIPLHRFVFCLQNHDQVGNRAFGDRLHHQVDLAAYRAAAALLLCAPETPLLFMGQEWAASSPFLYFTDHEPELGSKVTEGRRSEFSAFPAFADPTTRDSIPDPQAEATFSRSRLNWTEREAWPHAGILRLYEALLRLRRTEPALSGRQEVRSAAPHARPAESPTLRSALEVVSLDDETIAMRRTREDGRAILVVARLAGAGRIDIPLSLSSSAKWELVLNTEGGEFAKAGRPPRVDESGSRLAVSFGGPAALVLRRLA